jgi:hypothetical protein
MAEMNQHFPIRDPENFSQIGSFGLKTNHLATLLFWLKELLRPRSSSNQFRGATIETKNICFKPRNCTTTHGL